jgi:D-alanyl-D-alanine carboxypeptidase
LSPPYEDVFLEPVLPEIVEPEIESEPEPEPDEYVFVDPGYVLLRMSYEDISRGHLILINHDHAFVFPDESDSELISIFDHITDSFGVTTEHTFLAASIIDPLNAMMDAFYEETGITNVVVRSGYRGLAAQRQLFEDNVRRWGRAGALLWAKPPGHSEHHSGLGLDFGLRVGGAINTFTGTGTHSWIPRNSHNFGFVLRYPNNKTNITGTNFEPWHYRYVGIPHAPLMQQRNWVLEEYINNIRSFTADAPLEFTFNGILYQIYFTDELEIRLPFDVYFDVSGNNIDGFIVTTWEDPEAANREVGEEV